MPQASGSWLLQMNPDGGEKKVPMAKAMSKKNCMNTTLPAPKNTGNQAQQSRTLSISSSSLGKSWLKDSHTHVWFRLSFFYTSHFPFTLQKMIGIILWGKIKGLKNQMDFPLIFGRCLPFEDLKRTPPQKKRERERNAISLHSSAFKAQRTNWEQARCVMIACLVLKLVLQGRKDWLVWNNRRRAAVFSEGEHSSE